MRQGRNYVQKSKAAGTGQYSQQDNPSAGMSDRNRAYDNVQDSAQNTAQSSFAYSRKPVSGRTTLENESRSVSQLKSQGQQNSGIRRTGAVQPKVTTIEDLENNRDQDLREWKDPVSDSTERNRTERI